MHIPMNLLFHSNLLHRVLCAALLCLALTGSVVQAQSAQVSSADKALIDLAVAEASSRIQQLATTDPGAFAAVLQQALGARLDAKAKRDFVQKASKRQLPFPERILFVPSGVLADVGAEAAYATENGGVIFLSAGSRSESASLPDLILHEWGHHLDATLGAGDANGEEGEIFLLGNKNGGPIPIAEQHRLAASESGHATIDFEGRMISVELGFFDFIAAPFNAIADAAEPS